MVVTLKHIDKQKHINLKYYNAWILNQKAMKQTALMGRAQQCDSHLPPEKKKNWQVCAEFSKRHKIINNGRLKQNYYKKASNVLRESTVENISPSN